MPQHLRTHAFAAYATLTQSDTSRWPCFRFAASRFQAIAGRRAVADNPELP